MIQVQKKFMLDQHVHQSYFCLLYTSIQDIAYNDQKYKEFKSKNNIFKTNTTSTNYFEITRRAYFEQYAKPDASGIKVDEQITTITVEAGTIDDFFVNVKSKGTY